MPHAVGRLRAQRLARVTKPPPARGSRRVRCERCRLPVTHCLCAARPVVPTRAGFALLMHDVEALKPSNTGWLVADVVPDTAAFEWTRTGVDPRLLALLADPQWQPLVVFPAAAGEEPQPLQLAPDRRPLFVLLDATWRDAHKMARRSPYLDGLPRVPLRPAELSRYRLRQAVRDTRLCTAEAAALCLHLVGEERAARALDTWFDAFVARSMAARINAPPDEADDAHRRLAALG